MSGLDYSTFSLCSALTPSQPAPARSYPADPMQQHVAEDVIDSHISSMQRDDLPSSIEVNDRPREAGSYQGQGSTARTYAFSRPPLRSDSTDDIQGNILCAQLGGFHFTPQYSGHGHATVDEPTAITENSSWSSQHSLHYPTPVRGFVSQSSSIKSAGPIPEDVRPGLTLPHSDVSTRSPARRRPSMATSDRQFGRSFGFTLTAASSPSLPSMDVTPFLPGGMITSPSPPPSAYRDDDFAGANCSHFTYAEQQLSPMTHTPAHDASSSATHYPLDCHHDTHSFCGGFRDASHPSIISLDHRYATAMEMATPFPGYSSLQSPQDHDHPHPICGPPPSYGTAIHAQELPRPGSAPPLIDSQVPFVGDARAALQCQSPQDSASCGSPTQLICRPHANSWYPHLGTAQGQPSPRSSPRRAGSIGHNSQKTPPGSRHLRRWSSVTNPALRASPPPPAPVPAPTPIHAHYPPSTFGSAVVPFPRYPLPPKHNSSASSDNANAHIGTSHFEPSAESESDDPSTSTYGHAVPHAAVVDVPESMCASPDPLPSQVPSHPLQPTHPSQQPVRSVIRCDGHHIDEETWSAALTRPDKLLHVYECFWDFAHTPCGMWIEGDQSSVADHLALFHNFRGGEVTTRCLWRDCPKPHMKGTSIARHVVTHIGFRVKCDTCRHEFARVDACNRAHSRSGCAGVGMPMYGDLQRVLDARKVDPLQRPSKKRRTDD